MKKVLLCLLVVASVTAASTKAGIDGAKNLAA